MENKQKPHPFFMRVASHHLLLYGREAGFGKVIGQRQICLKSRRGVEKKAAAHQSKMEPFNPIQYPAGNQSTGEYRDVRNPVGPATKPKIWRQGRDSL